MGSNFLMSLREIKERADCIQLGEMRERREKRQNTQQRNEGKGASWGGEKKRR